MLEGEAADRPSGTSTGSPATSMLAHDGTEFVSTVQKPEKDPRKIARGYQLDLCKKALKENIIVYLGTGCGKTHIAVLLMYEMRHSIRKPQKSVCVFLAPTVALVHQQAKVIEESTDFIVGIHCGNLSHLKSHNDWVKEIEEYEVLVMTPQILLRNLSHSFIKMDMISLLIFDECHHAQVQKNHPYAEIMKIFYQNNEGKVPRIFGMTASPVVGRDYLIEPVVDFMHDDVADLLWSNLIQLYFRLDQNKHFPRTSATQLYLYVDVKVLWRL